MSLELSLLLLAISFAVVLAAAEIFTNGIEWFGKKLELAEGAVGSVLAAVGTALPETSIAIVAVVAGKSTHEVGIGAILGAPMMLSTLAMFITGFAVLVFARSGRRKRDINVNHAVLTRDLRAFFTVYIVAIAAAFMPSYSGKVVIAVFLVVAYIYYVIRTFRCESEGCPEGGEEEMRPLHFHRKAPVPRLRIVTAQVVFGLLLIFAGAKLFVDSVTSVSNIIGIPALVLGLLITPIATELPEKFNSITWVKQRKDTLALGNITGAMVFQSSITPAIGILFTPWDLGHNPAAMASAIIAIVATMAAWLEITLRKRLSPYSLLVGGLFYAAYPIYVFGFAK